MTGDAGEYPCDWLYLNEEGRRLLLERERASHEEPGAIQWDWRSVPFNRVSLINLVTRDLPACRYLEIGCDKDELFRALPIADKTGVDPVAGGTLRTTSDEFFAQNNRSFDVIFIDGLHTYSQVRRDVTNALAVLEPGGWIGLHDLLPGNWLEQHVPRVQMLWTGDVWKVAFELAQTPGIDFRIVAIDYGVGLVRLTGSTAPELVDLSEELVSAGFQHFREHLPKLPLIDWNAAQNWVGEVAAARYVAEKIQPSMATLSQLDGREMRIKVARQQEEIIDLTHAMTCAKQLSEASEKKAESLERELADTQCLLDQANDELERLRLKHSHEIDLEASLADYTTRLARAVEGNLRRDIELSRLANDLAGYRRSVETSREDFRRRERALADELKSALEMKDAMLTSTSWRITAPLRWLVTRLRGTKEV